MKSVLGESYCLRHMKVLKWLDDGFTDSEEMGQRFIEPEISDKHEHSAIHTEDLPDGNYQEVCSCGATRYIDKELQTSSEWTNDLGLKSDEHPRCFKFRYLGHVGANVCDGHEPWSCHRTQQEGKCEKPKPYTLSEEVKNGPHGKKS